MYRLISQRNYWLCSLLAASLLFTSFFPPIALAQDRKRKPVVLSFGQPNIWSLEQAHYLLARMHMTNLELQAKALSDTDLDPNATHGTRIEILKQLLEIQASFDQGVGFQNQRIVETERFNDTRRRELTSNRDHLRDQSMQFSLDLSQLRRERAGVADATSDKAKQLDAAIKEKEDAQTAVEKQITFQDAEIQRLGAEPSGTPSAATLPTPSESPRLPEGLLDKLTDAQRGKLFGEGRDPKLNATTMLDNTVQLQYEIIAKQLTLLRDEVGPGERLIFLELPQSIYTTPGAGDEKMAQAWWHVNGYTRTDPLLRALLELFEVEQKWAKIQLIPAYVRRKSLIESLPCKKRLTDAQAEQADQLAADSIGQVFYGLMCERENAREAVLGKLYREGNSLFSRVEQSGARDTSEMVEAIRKLVAVRRMSTSTDNDGTRVNAQVEAKMPGEEMLTSKSTSHNTEQERRQRMEQMKDTLLTILSEDDPLNPTSPQAKQALTSFQNTFQVKDGKEFEKGLEFIRLDEEFARPVGTLADIERRSVRTVDIIPRQSSLNVNDVHETVKSTGILGAFKFLFGFAGQVNFQRQREQFEQFVHQELYASGFGKGDSDFGWTFGALPGTKRAAPGVRTTYAALVVPADAESIVISARGCYFPRKSYQPLDFNDTGHSDWDNEDRYRRDNCGDEQTYILTIPGGGDTANFWVTNVDYQEGQKGGENVTVSVRGNNFSTQMGVLVDGVPLFTTVGLAQPNLMPKKAVAAGGTPQLPVNECEAAMTICGRYERIDPHQIVFSFKMPANYVGTPTITLIAPGKSVDLNSIPNLRINRTPNISLRDGAPFMFGKRPTAPALSIADLQLLNVSSDSAEVLALLTGTGFNAADEIYVNGREMGTGGTSKEFKSSRLQRLSFNLPGDETLRVTIVHTNAAGEQEVASKTIANPAALKITNTTVLSYVPRTKKPGVLMLKLEGAGFSTRLILGVGHTASPRSSLVAVSPGEVIVRVVNPGPVVVIRLKDISTNGSVSTPVQRPPDPQAP